MRLQGLCRSCSFAKFIDGHFAAGLLYRHCTLKGTSLSSKNTKRVLTINLVAVCCGIIKLVDPCTVEASKRTTKQLPKPTTCDRLTAQMNALSSTRKNDTNDGNQMSWKKQHNHFGSFWPSHAVGDTDISFHEMRESSCQTPTKHRAYTPDATWSHIQEFQSDARTSIKSKVKLQVTPISMKTTIFAILLAFGIDEPPTHVNPEGNRKFATSIQFVPLWCTQGHWVNLCSSKRPVFRESSGCENGDRTRGWELHLALWVRTWIGCFCFQAKLIHLCAIKSRYLGRCNSTAQHSWSFFLDVVSNHPWGSDRAHGLRNSRCSILHCLNNRVLSGSCICCKVWRTWFLLREWNWCWSQPGWWSCSNPKATTVQSSFGTWFQHVPSYCVSLSHEVPYLDTTQFTLHLCSQLY